MHVGPVRAVPVPDVPVAHVVGAHDVGIGGREADAPERDPGVVILAARVGLVCHVLPFQYRITGSELLTMLRVQMLLASLAKMIPGPCVCPGPPPPIWVQTPELESRDQTTPVLVRATLPPR